MTLDDGSGDESRLRPAPGDAMSEHATAFLEACRGAVGEPPRRFSDQDRSEYLSPTPPEWVTPTEPLSRYFEDQLRVLQEGRVVWGAIVQANDNLFAPGWRDYPAEVLHAPAPGQVDNPATLVEVAERIYALKGTAPDDEELAPLAHHVTDEMQRVFGMPVPTSLANGIDLELSTVFLHRRHLPSGYLRRSVIPVLVAPAPRLVMVLPERYWPSGLVEWWEAGWMENETTEPAPGWLGSIVGALHGETRVDIVIDTGQVVVLYRSQTPASTSERLGKLKSADRAALVAADPRNRRFAESEIALVTLTKQSRLTHNEKVPGKLAISSSNGDQLELRLDSSALMGSARRIFSKMLGPRFEG